MARAIFVKSSSKRKEASLELSAISLRTLQTLADNSPSLQFYEPF